MTTTPAHRLSRRYLLGTAMQGLALSALPLALRPALAAGRFSASDLGSGLTLLTGGASNILVLATSAGQVVTDTGLAADQADLLATLAELPGDTVTGVINTHWHHEQTGSNAWFGARGARIVAHERTRLKLANGYYLRDEDRWEAPLPAAAIPGETVYTTESLRFGEQQIDCGYLVQAHTDGDIYVAFPAANVIAIGDVAAPATDPEFDWFGGGWLGGRVDSLAQLLELGNAATRYVPAQGPVMSRVDLQAEHDMMLEFFERMVEHVRLGETAEDMLETGVLDGLGRTFADPAKLLYDTHKGFWAHHNKLMPDIV